MGIVLANRLQNALRDWSESFDPTASNEKKTSAHTKNLCQNLTQESRDFSHSRRAYNSFSFHQQTS
jgi:hypothetical protein